MEYSIEVLFLENRSGFDLPYCLKVSRDRLLPQASGLPVLFESLSG